MADKRTKAQFAFDFALHGIAFCSAAMARSKITQAEEILATMPEDKKRKEKLDYWRAQYSKES